MLLSGLEFGLFTDDTRTFDFVNDAFSIGDDPVAAEELNFRLALVGDCDVIAKNETRELGLRIVREILRFDFNLDALGCFVVHAVRIPRSGALGKFLALERSCCTPWIGRVFIGS